MQDTKIATLEDVLAFRNHPNLVKHRAILDKSVDAWEKCIDKEMKAMPKGTKVDEIYQAIKKKEMKGGKSKKKAQAKAAKIAQSKTGKSLATGKAPKAARKKRLESARF